MVSPPWVTNLAIWEQYFSGEILSTRVAWAPPRPTDRLWLPPKNRTTSHDNGPRCEAQPDTSRSNPRHRDTGLSRSGRDGDRHVSIPPPAACPQSPVPSHLSPVTCPQSPVPSVAPRCPWLGRRIQCPLGRAPRSEVRSPPPKTTIPGSERPNPGIERGMTGRLPTRGRPSQRDYRLRNDPVLNRCGRSPRRGIPFDSSSG